MLWPHLGTRPPFRATLGLSSKSLAVSASSLHVEGAACCTLYHRKQRRHDANSLKLFNSSTPTEAGRKAWQHDTPECNRAGAGRAGPGDHPYAAHGRCNPGAGRLQRADGGPALRVRRDDRWHHRIERGCRPGGRVVYLRQQLAGSRGRRNPPADSARHCSGVGRAGLHVDGQPHRDRAGRYRRTPGRHDTLYRSLLASAAGGRAGAASADLRRFCRRAGAARGTRAWRRPG